MESPSGLARHDSHGFSGHEIAGTELQDGVSLESLARLQDRMEGRARADGAAFRQCILDIISEVANLHGRRAEDVLPMIDMEHNLPSARTAYLCGLMIAELVSGCLRHADAGLPGLCVNITFRHTGAGKSLLSVAARCGRPQDRADPVRIGPAELEAVRPIVHQLRGELEGDERGGTLFRIIFCEAEPGTP